MGGDQPVEPEVQLLGDPMVLVVNPPVGQNENENVAQPQELEVAVFQSLLDASRYTCLSPHSGFSFSHTARPRDRLFTVPYFSVRPYRRCRSFSSTGPPSRSLDASETGERTKCPWVGVVGLIAWGEGAEKIGRL